MFASRRIHAGLSGRRLTGFMFAAATDEGPAGRGTGSPNGAASRLSLRLDPDVDAASKAREALERLEDQLEHGVLQDMHLLVTELVTNSVRHSGAPADEPVRVEVAVGGDRVFVAVEDGGPGFEPSPRAADAPRDSGWGLHLVERLSSRWGVTCDGCTRVWLELARRGRTEAAT